MHNKVPIAVEELSLQPFTTFDPEGILLVSGSGVENANPMTISWGMFGIMWKRPVVMVMVRTTRHTWTHIDNQPDFTVNWVGEELYEALHICGNKSGRDMDKFSASGLHREKSTVVNSPMVRESILTLECRTLYKDMVRSECFLNPQLLQLYSAGDFHGMFYGEVVAALGTEQYKRN